MKEGGEEKDSLTGDLFFKWIFDSEAGARSQELDLGLPQWVPGAQTFEL